MITKKLTDLETKEMSQFLGYCVIRQSGLVGISLLLELHVAEEHGCRHDFQDGGHVLGGHAHDAHRLARGLELGAVVPAGHRHRSVREE